MVQPQAPESEAEVMRRGARMLDERLPDGWSMRVSSEAGERDERIDGLIEVAGVDGPSATLLVEAKMIVEGRDVEPLRDRLDVLSRRFANAQGLVVARYLSPPVRARLTEAGLSYIDATGNMRVEIGTPGLFLSDRGADRDPWRGPGRPRGTLKGAPAARIVRAVADFIGPWRIRKLVDASKASTGATYRVVDYLEREGMATRDEDGVVAITDWAQVLRRWSDDYGFVRNSQTTRWIAVRGLPNLMERIGSTDVGTPYAVSGTLAAAEWSAYAPARLAMIYATDSRQVADEWGLRPAEAGANVILAEPEFDVVYERARVNRQGVVIACPSQVVVDLMTGPGRNPSEAEDLLEWMQKNEPSWRA